MANWTFLVALLVGAIGARASHVSPSVELESDVMVSLTHKESFLRRIKPREGIKYVNPCRMIYKREGKCCKSLYALPPGQDLQTAPE